MKPAYIKWSLACIDGNDKTIAPPLDLREAFCNIEALPPLPGMASRIMKLASDPLADAEKLASIVEMDPLLMAQIIRWAGSSLYGYRGNICNVKQAITNVLGYEFVFNLVLGLVALQPLKAPITGKIGIRAFWIHALASASLMRWLSHKVPDSGVNAQAIFSVALLHNIGFPLLGDKFVNEFLILSNLFQVNPELNFVKLEKLTLGVDHCELGSLLLRSWFMPKVIVDVIYHHHNAHYRGEFYRLNLLTYLNDHILAQLDVGDGFKQSDITEVLDVLSLTQDDYDEAKDLMSAEMDNIRAMVEIFLESVH